MTHVTSRCWMIVAVAGVLIVLRTTAIGQTAQPANQDTLAALLVEVRGLRSAMEQMASVGPRIQLAMGRLQLQEQRINTLVRRGDDLRQAIAGLQNEAVSLQQDLTRMQGDLGGLDAADRQHVNAQIAILKQSLARKHADIQRLQADEGDTATQVAGEQARWVEINQRLEELDRALTRR
jgi:chromosome segregation ATPase